MSTSFHSQLASIMDILAKAAVAEICELVDNGYAVLQLEISRSRKENKALKRKLQMMELRVARRSDDRIFLPRWANRCAKSAPNCDELNQTTSRMDKYFPTNVRGNEGLRDPDNPASLSAGGQSQDEEQIRPDPLLIKIEEQEEDFENGKPHEEVNINEQRAVVPDGGETVPIADTLTDNEMSIGKLAELHRTGHRVMEEDTMGTVLKAEQDNENGNLLSAGGRVNALGSKYAWHERSGSWNTFVQNTIQTETEGIAHSYSVETNLENMYIDSELASIMEVLANAAVAEICKLIDDGYAVLHSELSRNQKEIDFLRRKLSLQTMELRIAKEAPIPTTNTPFNKQLDNCFWKDALPLAEDREALSEDSNESADKVQVQSQSVQIKKETLEPDLEDYLRIRLNRAEECNGGEQTSTTDFETEPAIGSDELSAQHSNKQVLEDCGLDSGLKAETEQEAASAKDMGSEPITRRLNCLSYEYISEERSKASQLISGHSECAIRSATMSSCVVFHSQLASIMEVLTKAAVTEICQLVDDGYAVLRLEITRSEKENQTLKRKLQTLELMLARGYAAAGQRESSAACTGPDGPQAFDGSRGTERAAEGAFGSHGGISLWKDGEPTSLNEGDTSLASPMRNECTDFEEEEPQSLLIKEEMLEEDLESSHPQDAVESGGGERGPIADPQTEPGADNERLIEQHSTRNLFCENRGLDPSLKAEPVIKTVDLEHTEAENRAGRLDILDYDDIIQERSQMPFTMDVIPEKDKEGAVCSYPVEGDMENLSVHSELLSGKSLSSLGSLDMKREEDAINSELLKVDAEIPSAWSKDIISGVISSQQSYYGKDWPSDALLLESDSSVCPSQTEMAVRDNALDIRSSALGMNGWSSYKGGVFKPYLSFMDPTKWL
ncbi:hypothetical protein GJAV_G00095220 [Gymnothorax javanicus]|nr:hypothetical protein GJAV_G00095220 [Gymnothorax javanicus]